MQKAEKKASVYGNVLIVGVEAKKNHYARRITGFSPRGVAEFCCRSSLNYTGKKLYGGA